jgi:hypothetical protein
MDFAASDADFSIRWRLIKSRFVRSIPAPERLTHVRQMRGERGIWQRRFWEHLIRDEADYSRHVEYCYINPVSTRLSVACQIGRIRHFVGMCGRESSLRTGQAESNQKVSSVNAPDDLRR